MAGTLTISTLSDGTNSTSATNCIQGSARAWVYFDGATGSTTTIKGSFNVSSVTYVSTGNYTVNYTTAMPNANYATNVTSGLNYGYYSSAGAVRIDGGLPTTTSVQVCTTSTNTTSFVNSAYVAVAIFSS